jgi:monofunctional glycosyltransferase
MSGRLPPRPGHDPDETLLWPPGEEPPPPAVSSGPRRFRTVAWRIARAALIVLAAYYVVALLLLVTYRFVPPPTTAVQIQRSLEARIAGGEYEARKVFLPYAELSRHAPRAVVAAEDGSFWSHRGFAWGEMRSAAREALEGGRMRGASTITQQLMKNLFGCACRNPIRKVYDVTLTPAAELILGKERILELYLNEVEWGPGIYGIEAAARHHYGVGAKDLSRSQAAGLAALLPNPRRRTPENTPQYRASILRRMEQRGW